ncbi:MAG: hypothetical protein ACI935_001756, partial [Moritella dasanensis]
MIVVRYNYSRLMGLGICNKTLIPIVIIWGLFIEFQGKSNLPGGLFGDLVDKNKINQFHGMYSGHHRKY